jgi:hypothetical protein
LPQPYLSVKRQHDVTNGNELQAQKIRRSLPCTGSCCIALWQVSAHEGCALGSQSAVHLSRPSKCNTSGDVSFE